MTPRLPWLRYCLLEETVPSLLEIICKYGVLISKLRCLYYALLELSMNKITLRKNVRVDDWTAERAIITSNGAEVMYY